MPAPGVTLKNRRDKGLPNPNFVLPGIGKKNIFVPIYRQSINPAKNKELNKNIIDSNQVTGLIKETQNKRKRKVDVEPKKKSKKSLKNEMALIKDNFKDN